MVGQPREIAVVLLAAGKGTRMKSRMAKVLHPIAGRPMLAYPLAAAEGLEPARLIAVVGIDAHGLELFGCQSYQPPLFLLQEHGGAAEPLDRARQGRLQRRHHACPHSIAKEARIGVGRVLAPRQPRRGPVLA